MRSLILMLKVLWSPGEAFREIQESGIRPWVPLLVFIVFGILSTYLLTNRIDIGEALTREILLSPQAGNMSQEDMVNLQRTFSENSPFIAAVMYGASLIFVGMSLIVGALYFGIFLILGSRSRFMDFWSTTTYAFTPMLISTVAGIGVMFTIPPSAMRLGQMNVLSPAVFMDPQAEAGALYALAQSLSVTTLWALALLVIGYGVVGSSRTNVVVRTVVVLIPWLLVVAVRVLPALIF